MYDVATDTFTYQSRERELSLTSDNAGFMLHQMKHENMWKHHFRGMANHTFEDRRPIKIAYFGEWCGQGIQKGVAISQIPKMFVIFAAKFIYEDKTTEWIDISKCRWDQCEFITNYVHFIDTFPTYEIDIDFNHPELAQNKMIEITEEVEKECPVGKAFGVSGIGEGVVWTCVSPGWNDSGTWFKVKGEKHSVSKVRTLAAVDVEAVANLKAFVDSVVTEARLEQGLDNLVREQLKQIEMTSMGDFLRWVYNDVLKEEADTIVANGIDPKKLGGAIANTARPWFVKKVNEGIGL